MSAEARLYYDRYWSERDRPRAEPRSRERAVLTLDLLAHLRNNGRLVDFGCGPGWSLEVFRDAGFQVAGVDASKVAVDEVEARGFRAICLDVEADGLDAAVGLFDEPPDVVVALEVLEHLHEPRAFLEALAAVLPAEAAVVVSLPNEIHILARLKILFGRLPFGGHDDPHVRHFDRRRACSLLRAAGYEIVAKTSVHMVPPRRPWLRAFLRPALWLLPGAFSLATIYLLRRNSGD